MGMSAGGMVGMGLSVLGSFTQAGASRKAGKAQKQLAEYNAELMEVKAEDALVRGREAEQRLRLGARGMIGASRAAFAASGVEVNDPDSTAGNVAADIKALSEVDALTIRSNAAREAWGYRAAATDLRFGGEVAEQEGNQKAIGTLLSTGGSLLYQKYGFGSTTRLRD